MTLRIRPEALDDIQAAMAWYDGREPVEVRILKQEGSEE